MKEEKMQQRNNEFDKRIGEKTKNQVKIISPKIIKNKKDDNLWKFLLIFVLFFGIVSFSFLTYKGYFKTSQNVSLTPENNLETNNQYNFTPITDNKYAIAFPQNYTINIFVDGSLLNQS